VLDQVIERMATFPFDLSTNEAIAVTAQAALAALQEGKTEDARKLAQKALSEVSKRENWTGLTATAIVDTLHSLVGYYVKMDKADPFPERKERLQEIDRLVELLLRRESNRVEYLKLFANFQENLALPAYDELGDQEEYAASARRLARVLGSWDVLTRAETLDAPNRKQFVDRKLRSLALVSQRLSEFAMELDRSTRPPTQDRLLYDVILPVAKDMAERCLYDLGEY